MGEQPSSENLNEQPEKEQAMEAILDALESAFEKGAEAELTVVQSSGELRTCAVFILGLEDGMLSVAASKDSPVIQIKIGDIKKVLG